MQNYKKDILSIGVVGILLVLVWSTVGIFFETNDDRVITEILSGVITVGPDAHTVFQNYFFSSMIAGLYVLIPNIPWYGLALIVIQALAYVFVLDTIYCRCASKSEMVFASATVVFVFFSNIYMLGRIQFTSTAMIAAIAGYVCLILSDTSKRQWIFFFILELFALFLRKDSMLVIVPIGLAVLIGKWLIDSQLTFKQRRNYLVRIFGILGCVLLIGYLGDIVGYSSPEWREYRKLNQARAELFDYFEEPAYEEIKPILDSHGITKASYEAYCNYTMLDTSMTSECVEEIVAYCMNQKKEPKGFVEGLRIIYKIWMQDYHWKINQLAVVTGGLFLIWIAVCRRFKLLIPVVGLLCAELIVWFYLYSNGRYPLRIMLPLFATATAFVVSLAYEDIMSRKTVRWQKKLVAFLGLLFFCEAFFCINKQYVELKSQKEASDFLVQGVNEIHEYCRNQEEYRFLLDASILEYGNGRALETALYKQRNDATTGNWYSYSPSMNHYMKKYFEEDISRIRIIVCDDGNGRGDLTLRYLEEAEGKRLVQTDSFTVCFGGKYLVYKFE